MKKLIMQPDGWPCTLAECRPGYFVFNGEYLGFKSGYYSKDNKPDAYNEAGEFYWGDSEKLVQPVNSVWEESEAS